MGLLSRYEKLALSLSIVLLVAVLIPTSFPAPGHGTWRCTTQAWASGSPDETLNPPSSPPKKAGAFIRGAHFQSTRDDRATSASPAASRLDLRTLATHWTWMLRIYLTFSPRI